MSRTIKGSKSPGYDYWSRRPFSGRGFGKAVRNVTHRKERAEDKKIEHEAKLSWPGPFMKTYLLFFAYTYIHGWYFGVHSLEWINILGVLAHGSVIA